MQDENRGRTSEEIIHAVQFDDPRAVEARRLRVEDGLSFEAIRQRFKVGKGKLGKWLKGTLTPEQSRRPNAKDELREQARELRAKGKTYDEIMEELGVSKSSVSLWVRDVSVINVPAPGWSPRARRLREEATKRRQADKIAKRMERRAAVARAMPEFTEREILVAGAIAYWCEGSKWKEWQSSPPGLAFINSDPGLIRLFLSFLKVAPVQFGELRYRLNIHESADELAAQRFWAAELGIELSDFSKTVLKRHNPKTVRKNVGAGYHGCLTVNVLQSRALYDFIDGMVAAVLCGVAPPPVRLPALCGQRSVYG